MKVEIGQIISQILSFLILLWILKKFAWKPILSRLDERKNKIKDEYEDIEQKKSAVEEKFNEYNDKLKAIDVEIQAKVREAVEKAQKMTTEILGEARSQARIILEKAEVDAQNEIKKARIQLKNEIVNLTIAATAKICEAGLDQEKQNKLISDFVDQAELK